MRGVGDFLWGWEKHTVRAGFLCWRSLGLRIAGETCAKVCNQPIEFSKHD